MATHGLSSRSNRGRLGRSAREIPSVRLSELGTSTMDEIASRYRDMTDRELLVCYTAESDGAAFGESMSRHGPSVLRRFVRCWTIPPMLKMSFSAPFRCCSDVPSRWRSQNWWAVAARCGEADRLAISSPDRTRVSASKGASSSGQQQVCHQRVRSGRWDRLYATLWAVCRNRIARR